MWRNPTRVPSMTKPKGTHESQGVATQAQNDFIPLILRGSAGFE